MGIKFYCPNGHKVHVKSFLAGKKGLCPKCGVRVDVPRENVSSGTLSAAGEQPDADSDGDAFFEQGMPGATVEVAAQAVTFPDQKPGIKRTAESEFHLMPSAKPLESSSGRYARETSSNDGEPGLENIHLTPEPAPSVPLDSSVSVNPMWHVQLTTGQQFGPLSEATVGQWLADSRIVANDMVWREGWPQWQLVQAVFAQHGAPAQAHLSQPATIAGGFSQADNPLAEAIQSSQSNSPTVSLMRQQHRGKREIRARLSLVLLGLVILLFALLLYIFFIRQQPEDQTQASFLSLPVLESPFA